MKTKIEKLTIFRVDGKDFETEADANDYLREKEKTELYTRISDIAFESYETGEELLDFIGNLSNKELATIRQMTHKKG